MVFKNISRIKSTIPEVLHIAMFYDNGTIFQATFDQDINIPKLGENLAQVLNHMRKLYEICQFELKTYEKVIFDTEDISIMILKLGEQSNIALFFKKEDGKSLKISTIRRYLTKIEELIDMDKREIELELILKKEEELKHFIDQRKKTQERINLLKVEENKINQVELDSLLLEIELKNSQIDQLNNEIDELKNRIHKVKNANID